MNKNWELINFCEFDKYATKSYCAIHKTDESLNLGDITKIDEKNIEDFTMMCGGSPCQDFSVCGKQEGAVWTCNDCGHKYNPIEAHYTKRDKCPICGSYNIGKTRSSLLVEWLRILKAKNPKFAIYENVKNIIGKQFKSTFDLFISELNDYGYNTYYKVLNAKEYGIPQGRERVYLIIIRKDLDNGKFNFPIGFDNNKRIKDILENNVDEKYYLTKKQIENIYNWKANQRPFTRILGKNSFCPTITARGCGEYHSGMIIYSDLLSNNTNCETVENPTEYIMSLHPRVLTEKESFRLIGFTDEDYQNCVNNNIPKRQLYKVAGNSIVEDVLYYIYLELYKSMPYLFDNLKLSSFFSGIGAFEIALNRLYKYIMTNEE